MTDSPLVPSSAASASASSGGAAGVSAAAAAHGVDVQRLADKVYALLLADVRLGWARGDWSVRPQRKGEA